MARRRYLVAYDIRDDRRLRQIASCMEGYGERIQYSVFVCDLSDQEFRRDAGRCRRSYQVVGG
jgi:CRISPR-associated protein Cas2